MRVPRFTLLELVIVAGIIAIIMSIAMPMCLHSHARRTETSAIASLQAINQAQHVFAQACGRQRCVVASEPGQVNPGTADAYLGPDLTGAQEVEERLPFRMSGTETISRLRSLTGETPVELSGDRRSDDAGFEWRRFFGTNTTVIVYENLKASAARMPETGAANLGQQIKGIAR